MGLLTVSTGLVWSVWSVSTGLSLNMDVAGRGGRQENYTDRGTGWVGCEGLATKGDLWWPGVLV
jgi:hypothetical protein